MKLETESQRYGPEVSAEIAAIVGASRLPLYDMIRYHLGRVEEGTEGLRDNKPLRSTLCLMTCEVVGGDWRTALPAAAAVDLVHDFSLIHNDIEGQSPKGRRGGTLSKVWGQAQAINAGDALFALARLALLRLRDKHVPDQKVLQSVASLDEACLQLTTGQYLDISYEERTDMTVTEYMNMISAKAAALFACSFHLGSLTGCDDPDRIRHFHNFGHEFGIAYQIRDDVAALWSERPGRGKSRLPALRQKRKMLPVVRAFEVCEGETRQQLDRMYRQERLGNADVDSLFGIFDHIDARKYCDDLAAEHAEYALAELSAAGLPAKTIKDLQQITAQVLAVSR